MPQGMMAGYTTLVCSGFMFFALISSFHLGLTCFLCTLQVHAWPEEQKENWSESISRKYSNKLSTRVGPAKPRLDHWKTSHHR
jgi:hypothetical protein